MPDCLRVHPALKLEPLRQGFGGALFLANPLKESFSLQFINNSFIDKPRELEIGFCAT
jgi:hypothetical protein